MLTLGASNWIAVLLYGALALILSWFTSGCRVGNQVVEQPDPDQYSGYYTTQPQSLTFYVTTSNTEQRAAPVKHVPPLISEIMTNPVALIMLNLDSGRAVLTPDGKRGLPIFLDPDNSFSYSALYPEDTYWRDPECQSRLELTQLGMVTKNPGVASPPGNKHALSGSIHLKVQVVTQFSGNCGPTFQVIADCYSDSSLCGGTHAAQNQQVQADIAAIFDPMIQAKVITVADIPNIRNYAYEVVYE